MRDREYGNYTFLSFLNKGIQCGISVSAGEREGGSFCLDICISIDAISLLRSATVLLDVSLSTVLVAVALQEVLAGHAAGYLGDPVLAQVIANWSNILGGWARCCSSGCCGCCSGGGGGRCSYCCSGGGTRRFVICRSFNVLVPPWISGGTCWRFGAGVPPRNSFGLRVRTGRVRRCGRGTVIVRRCCLHRVGLGLRRRERIGSPQERVEFNIVRVIGDRVLVLDDAPSVVANLSVSARRTFSCRPVGHAIARRRVEAEQLGTDSVVFETGAGASIHAALGVQREQFAG